MNRTMKTTYKPLAISAMLLVALATSACQENEFGTVDLSGYTPDPATTTDLTYSHPIALYTATDFARVKTAIADGTLSPEAKKEFEVLQNNTYTSGDYGTTVHAHQQIVRGDAKGTIEGKENYGDAMRDAAAAYQFGLLWQLTGNEDYAAKGIKILNGWAQTCQEVTSNDANHFLAAGCQGFTFALAAEELRDYSAWTESDFTIFKNWMTDVFASKNYNFLMLHANVTCGAKHYWSNWDLVNLCSYLQIGILTESDDMVKFVIEYFTNSGAGNGALKNLVCGDGHTDPLGSGETLYQNQESGRDQGHACMSTAVCGQLCQAAWALYQCNPTVTGLDFFSLNDNAVLKMAEFVAMTNLRQGTDNANAEGSWVIEASKIPWTTVGPWCTGSSNHAASQAHESFADDSGRGTPRPGWEIFYNHYKQQGVAGTTYCQMYAEKLRPECGSGDSRYGNNSGAFDQIGWGTLMMYR